MKVFGHIESFLIKYTRASHGSCVYDAHTRGQIRVRPDTETPVRGISE